MPQFRLELWKSEEQPGGPATLVIISPEFVQVTFNDLRIGPDGDSIARFRDGVWHTEDGEWYSDFTITEVK